MTSLKYWLVSFIIALTICNEFTEAYRIIPRGSKSKAVKPTAAPAVKKSATESPLNNTTIADAEAPAKSNRTRMSDIVKPFKYFFNSAISKAIYREILLPIIKVQSSNTIAERIQKIERELPELDPERRILNEHLISDLNNVLTYVESPTYTRPDFRAIYHHFLSHWNAHLPLFFPSKTAPKSLTHSNTSN